MNKSKLEKIDKGDETWNGNAEQKPVITFSDSESDIDPLVFSPTYDLPDFNELFELKKFSPNLSPSTPILLLLMFNISKALLLCNPGNNNFAHLSSIELCTFFK